VFGFKQHCTVHFEDGAGYEIWINYSMCLYVVVFTVYTDIILNRNLSNFVVAMMLLSMVRQCKLRGLWVDTLFTYFHDVC